MKKLIKFGLFIFIAIACPILIYNQEKKVIDLVTEDNIVDYQTMIEDELTANVNEYSFDDPMVVLNPYGNSPLTALILFKTRDLTTPTITVKGDDELSTFTHTFSQDNYHVLPVYGLYADRDNEVILSMNGREKVINIKTDKLPDDFVKPTSVYSKKELLNNDLYFFTPSSNGYTCAYDVNGEVRWYLTTKNVWDINRLDNGHLLLSSDRLVNKPYYMTGLYEMDLTGKVYTEYKLPGGYHHDVVELPNNNLLVASDYFYGGTVEDYLVELDRTSGEISKTFDLKDILPSDLRNNEYYTEYDWFHNNSVWYDEKTKSIILSGRHQDAVISVDYKTGSLNWIIGDSTGWPEEYQKYFFKPIGDNFEWQWAQHAAMVLPNGDIFIFDNGNNRSKDEENYVASTYNYSRGVIYRINTNDMTIEQVYQYGKERGSDYYSPYISDVDYLGDNHYVISSGGHSVTDGVVNNNAAGLGKVDSLNSITTELLNNEVIFEIELPTNTYRVEKLSLYSEYNYSTGPGISLGSLGVTKSDGIGAPFIFSSYDKSIIEKYNISFVKESDRLVFNGTFSKSDKVSVILNRLSSRKYYNVIISNKPYAAMCVDLFNEESSDDKINVTKYINNDGLTDRYELYVKINGKIYKMNQAVTFNRY